MGEVWIRIVASLVSACLFCVGTFSSLGAMQQAGYKNGGFWRWLKRKGNLYYNRLAVFALCLALSTTVVSLCFSFLGTRWALVCSSAPFFVLTFLFLAVDSKYALKVQTKRTGRIKRLFTVYLLLTACTAYIFIAVLYFLSKWNGSDLYGLVAYAPFAILPVLLPLLLCLANAITGVFENARNRKFVKRAGQVLDETEITRVAIVGSYGKTSVKNILCTLLSQKYAVVETPASYNTPVGIAKTVFSDAFQGKEILIAEMGARKRGDIEELCDLVKPDYAIFTGVCQQHIQTFGSLDGVWEEKSKIFGSAKTVVCGESLRERASGFENACFANGEIKEVELKAAETRFTLCVDGQEKRISVKLLGNAAIENISLAVSLCVRLGLTMDEIANGLEKLQPIPHRLQLMENGGVYILDDGYNCNPRGAKEGIAALARFDGRKCIVTPGIVECGVLEESINEALGGEIAAAGLDKVILVGDTLVGAVKTGYKNAGGDEEKLSIARSLEKAKEELSGWIQVGDAVLFLNDLPDVY